MIRGSFRGFISGWPGVIMITIAILVIFLCFCCWCASIFYGRSAKRRRHEEISGSSLGPVFSNSVLKSSPLNPTVPIPLEIMPPMELGQTEWVPPLEPPPKGPCPYPADPSLDGMPRPCV